MPSRIVIFANGELAQQEHIRALLRPDDFILCADGGTRHALTMDLRPDLVVGDLDSLTSDDLERLISMGCAIEQHPVDKDETDLELALRVAQRLQMTEVLLVAGMGGRLDQSIANLLLLAGPQFSDLRLSLAVGDQTAWVIRKQMVVYGNPGDTVSTLALSPTVEGLTYSAGLSWPLKEHTLAFGSSRGISNELVANRAEISLISGVLLVIHIPQPTS
ncbi:MAG: thiamine diphosphokinase [Proteobacteria bacterium]|nr:thiamine diphosphokinase [Pseudomonadota bacterium]